MSPFFLFGSPRGFHQLPKANPSPRADPLQDVTETHNFGDPFPRPPPFTRPGKVGQGLQPTGFRPKQSGPQATCVTWSPAEPARGSAPLPEDPVPAPPRPSRVPRSRASPPLSGSSCRVRSRAPRPRAHLSSPTGGGAGPGAARPFELARVGAAAIRSPRPRPGPRAERPPSPDRGGWDRKERGAALSRLVPPGGKATVRPEPPSLVPGPAGGATRKSAVTRCYLWPQVPPRGSPGVPSCCRVTWGGAPPGVRALGPSGATSQAPAAPSACDLRGRPWRG